MMLENIAWAEKFRPATIDECFLPTETAEYLNKIVTDGDVPSLLFVGPSGIGKTTAALALTNELGYETLKINASKENGIDNIRVEIQQFASTISFNGKRKAIILDEADGLSAAAQAALRSFLDEFEANALFIFTANFRNKIIEPIQSRLTAVNFLFPKSQKGVLAKGLLGFLVERLKETNVEYDIKAVQQFIVTNINTKTDIRAIITDAQKIAKTGVFNTESLMDNFAGKFDEIVTAIQNKNFVNMRKWVGENSDIDANFLYRHLYDNLSKLMTTDNQVATVISIINEHQYKNAFVADKEINLVSCLCEISSVI